MTYENTTTMTNFLITSFAVLSMVAISFVNGAAMSFQERLCEMVHPELTRCRLICTDGKVWRDGCPVCACRSSLCLEKTCNAGQMCAIVQRQTGVYEDQLTDFAVCQPDTRNLHVVTQTTPAPTSTPKEYLGSCDFQGHCDLNGNCPSGSICRKDGLCCKTKRDDYNMGSVTNGMARCMEKPEVGQCRGLGIQYVFKKETGRCESMMFGGCVTSRNSFPTMKLCEETCEHPCQKPKTFGRCRASIPRYYFNEATEACEAFDLGGCAGVDNYFMTPWACETHCKGLKKKSRNQVKEIDRGQPIPIKKTPVFKSRAGNVNQNERETLRENIVNGFRKQPDFEDRGKPAVTDNGNINFKSRPQPERRMYTVDENGNVIYVNPDTFVPKPTTTTTTTANLVNQNNVNSNDNTYRHLGDRVRSAQGMVNGFEHGQVNYNNPRLRTYGGAPTYEDRIIYTKSKGRTYQSSVDAIRQFLARS